MNRFIRKHSLARLSGFTLIELLITISVISILSVMTLGSFSRYSDKQTLKTSAEDVVSMLQMAKSRTQSQVKPPACGAQTLDGYKVAINTSAKTYVLSVLCGSLDSMLVTRSLPSGVSFTVSGTKLYIFRILTDTVQTGGQVQVVSGSQILTINVDTVGNISVK